MPKQKNTIRASDEWSQLLELSERLGNVSAACKAFGVSRDTFYRRKRERNPTKALKSIQADVLPNGHYCSAASEIAARPNSRGGLVRRAETNRRTAEADKPSRRKGNSTVADKTSATASKIVAASLDLFATQNYSTVTMKDIAKKTRLNAALVYYYFKNKEGLFLYVVDRTASAAVETFERIRAQKASPRDVVFLWIENHALQFDLMRKLLKISIDYATTQRKSMKIERVIRKFYRLEAQILEGAITTGVETGQFRPTDVKSTARLISTFLDGVLVRSIMMPEMRAEATIRDFRDFLLGSLILETAGPAGRGSRTRVPALEAQNLSASDCLIFDN